MDELGIQGTHAHADDHGTRSDRHARVSHEHVKRNFAVHELDVFWIGELNNYIGTQEGSLYLVSIVITREQEAR